MKRLIKKRAGELYYAGGGQWTPEATRAKHFASLDEILHEKSLHKLHDCCSVLLRFPGGRRYDIELAL